MQAPAFSPTIALLTLARSAEVDVARILEPAGLSVRKLAILQRLASLPGATPGDLARAVGITEDEVAPMLRAMSTAGLIRRGRDGILSAAEAGTTALARVDSALADLDTRLFAERLELSAALYDATVRPPAEPQD